MTVAELRDGLRHLVESYVSDPADRGRLHQLIARGNVPAKSVLADLDQLRSGELSEADRHLVREIALNFV